MKRLLITIISIFILAQTSAFCAEQIVKKSIHAKSVDNFNIKATLMYKKDADVTDYNTVLLIHSLGYNSQWWGNLPDKLLEHGFAVVTVDLRGHGTSTYNSKLTKISWKDLKLSGYKKYPDDIVAVINEINDENIKKEFFKNWIIVGADIGANAGVIAADKYKEKPKLIVMITPCRKIKDLYIPVSIAQLGNVDFLAIYQTDDLYSAKESDYLKKFAQAGYNNFSVDSKNSGMLMFKKDDALADFITEWISQYKN